MTVIGHSPRICLRSSTIEFQQKIGTRTASLQFVTLPNDAGTALTIEWKDTSSARLLVSRIMRQHVPLPFITQLLRSYGPGGTRKKKPLERRTKYSMRSAGGSRSYRG